MKKSIMILLFLVPALTTIAQPLTKEQMYEDYDQLYDHLTSHVPHFCVRKKVTGHDIPKELRQIRQRIDTVSSDVGFYDVISYALRACNDAHISYNYNTDSVTLAHTVIARNRDNKRPALGVVYIDGKYYTPGFCSGEKEVLPYMSQLTHVCGIPVDKYISKYNHYLGRSRWDFKRKKEWTSKIYDPRPDFSFDKFTWTVIIDGKPQTFDMSELNFHYVCNYFDDFMFKVDYFDRDSTLYIRIPEMNINQAEWLENQIASHKGKPFNRVVIDVRNNGGGNDLTWHRVLSAIIDKPLYYKLRQATKSEVTLPEGCTIIDEKKVYGENIKPFLDEDSESYLQPSENTISYDGPIYVMVDRNIFSSTYSLLCVCQRSDRLISVGEPTGYLGGMGGTPWGDVLRHSRLSYRYPITLDITDVDEHNPQTFYKDKVDIEIWPTVEEKNFQMHYNNGQHSEEYLYNHDWTFKKILSLRK